MCYKEAVRPSFLTMDTVMRAKDKKKRGERRKINVYFTVTKNQKGSTCGH